ncbi:MAG TPA: DNA polymerase III subunit delta [Armatimonadota bacterium]|jgi:DNA polymerase-3 subunit delta
MANEKNHPVYFLKGKEAVLRNEALNSLIERFTDAAFRDFDLERIDGRDATAERVLSALGGVPFASEKRVVVVDDAQRMPTEEVEKIQKLLPKSIGAMSVVIFVAGETGEEKKGGDDNGGGKSAQKVAGIVRRLDSLCKSLGVVQKFDVLKPPEAARWLAAAVARTGKSMDTQARTELLARVGCDLGALAMELDKLAAFSGNRATITRDDVRTVVSESTEFSVFVMTDAICAGNAALALSTLHGLRANNEPALRILPMIAWQYRLVWQAKMMAEDRTAADRLPREKNLLKMGEWNREKAAKQARMVTWERLRRAFRLILDRDLALKGIEGPAADEDESLETLIVELCRKG